MDLAQRLERAERENAMLRAENDGLRARIGDLERDALAGEPVLPIEWRLTATEARVFGALLARERATKDRIMAVLYADRPADGDVPEMKICDVLICKLRKKVAPFGVKIFTVWGSGWRLDPETRAAFVQARAA